MSAERDARMLAGIRSWRAGVSPAPYVAIGRDDLDLLLRIADDRDRLARELCEEQQGRGRHPLDGEARS